MQAPSARPVLWAALYTALLPWRCTVCRLVVQGGLALYHLQAAVLDETAAKVAQGVVALSAASFLFVLSQLALSGRAARKAAAAKEA